MAVEAVHSDWKTSACGPTVGSLGQEEPPGRGLYSYLPIPDTGTNERRGRHCCCGRLHTHNRMFTQPMVRKGSEVRYTRGTRLRALILFFCLLWFSVLKNKLIRSLPILFQREKNK